MKSFLKTGNRGYPPDYLLSRVKGRRAGMIMSWEPILLAGSHEEYLSSSRYKGIKTERKEDVAWRYFMYEIRWIYSQMNDYLQNIFMPFFQYLEIRTISLALRLKADRQDSKIKELLDQSLLSENLKGALINSENILYSVEAIEDSICSLSDRFRGIREAFLKEGIKGAEQSIADSYLEFIMGSKLHPVIRDCFIYIIDLRNTIALYKNLWWNIRKLPTFIKGGNVSEKRLRQIMDKDDLFEIVSLVRKFIGIRIDTSEIRNIENIFLKGISKYLRRKGREEGIGLLLDYIWRCYIEVRNLSAILYGKDIDREIIAGEIVK